MQIQLTQLVDSLENHDLIQKVLEQAPRYSLNILGKLPDANAGRETFTSLPEGLDRRLKYVFGVKVDNELIGVVDFLVGYPRTDVGYIGLLLLTEKFQKQKIGTEVYRELEKLLRTFSQIKTLRLSVVASNGDVGRFWQKMGFHFTGEEKPFAESVARLMEKNLSNPGN